MIREIKFCGKSIEKDEWVTGNLLLPETPVNGERRAYIGRPFAFMPYTTVIAIYPDSIGRFTGFQDMRGEDIFFGDVIRQKLEDFICKKGWYWWYGVVKEVTGCAVINQLDFDYSKCKFPDDYTFLYDEASNIEVIGKSYDEPKLKNQCKHF